LEASVLQHASRLPALPGRSPLLRLQSDERLIALTRRGNAYAFEALVQRYQSRLLAFCRHMLGSTEDAEDILQEVFAASFNAVLADDRAINVRPWLYRIARNRCLNHLRRPVAAGQDSMDVFERDGGTTTADTVHKREEFRQIVRDVQDLPETQRSALLLREIDALSYDQIAEAMDTTVPSVKSLLVRARVSLAEAAEARLLSCEEVRIELGEVAEGLTRTSPPVRRHLKGCERCRMFRTELRRANRALAAVYPVGPIVALKVLFSKLLGGAAGGSGATSGSGAGAGAAGGAGAGSAGVAGAGSAGVAGATAGATTTGGFLGAGAAGLATKAATGLAAAALVTAGAAEVRQVTTPSYPAASGHSSTVASNPRRLSVAATPQIAALPVPHGVTRPHDGAAQKAKAASQQNQTPSQQQNQNTATSTPPSHQAATTKSSSPTPQPAASTTPAGQPSNSPSSSPSSSSNQPQQAGQSQQDSSTVTLAPDSSSTGSGGGSGGSGSASDGSASGGGGNSQSQQPPPSSPAGEPSPAPPAPPAPPAGESPPPIGPASP